MLKRVTILVTASVFTLGLLSGCSFSSTSTETSETVVKVWNNAAHSKDIMEQQVAEFNGGEGAKKGIKIEYIVHGGDYQKTVDLAIAADTAPDIFSVSGAKDPLVLKGHIVAIEDMPGGSEFLERYDGYLVPNINIFRGKTYSVPHSLVTTGLIYNKDMFRKAGIVDENNEPTPPKTFDEMVEYAKALTNPQQQEYGIGLPLQWNGFFNWHLSVATASSFGRRMFDPVEGNFGFDIYEPIFRTMLRIKDNNSFFPGAEGLDNDNARAQFAEGRIGMLFSASWDVGVLNEQFPAKIDWGVAPVPYYDSNLRYKQVGSLSDIGSISYSALKNDESKVMEVFKWLNSEKLLALLYSESKSIPYKAEIVDMAEKNPEAKGFEEFSRFIERTDVSPLLTQVNLEGDSFVMAFLKIWAGSTTIENGIADLNKRYNEALQRDIKDGIIDLNVHINKNYNTKLD